MSESLEGSGATTHADRMRQMYALAIGMADRVSGLARQLSETSAGSKILALDPDPEDLVPLLKSLRMLGAEINQGMTHTAGTALDMLTLPSEVDARFFDASGSTQELKAYKDLRERARDLMAEEQHVYEMLETGTRRFAEDISLVIQEKQAARQQRFQNRMTGLTVIITCLVGAFTVFNILHTLGLLQ